MAKEISDLTTIDLFSDEKRPGRPKRIHTRAMYRLKLINVTKLNVTKLTG